jgi:hypothetical protein
MVEGRAGLDGVSSSQGEASDADIPFDGADVALTAMPSLARPRVARGFGGRGAAQTA